MSQGTKTPVQAAVPVAGEIIDRLEPHVQRAVIAGSIRRGKARVSDIEIVAEPKCTVDLLGDEHAELEPIHRLARELGDPTKMGDRFIQVPDVLESGLTLDLFLVHWPADWGVVLAIRTGPADFSQEMVTRLRRKGWRCKDGRVLDADGEHVPCPTEEDFFRACGVEYLEPEERGR